MFWGLFEKQPRKYRCSLYESFGNSPLHFAGDLETIAEASRIAVGKEFAVRFICYDLMIK
jgi:hypothetical protein